MMHRILIAALLVGTPIAASAQLRPSEPEAVAGAVVDCWAAVGAKSVDRALLTKRGWKAGSITTPQGDAAGTPLQVYGKADSNVVLMLMSTANAPACSILSGVRSASDVSLAAQAVQGRLTLADPKVGTARSGQSIVFISLPKMAMFDATGTKAQPGVRITVSFSPSEKK